MNTIYTQTDRVALSGLDSTPIASRASIEKALPKTKKSNLTIGWANGTLASPFMGQQVAGAAAECKKYGYTFKMVDADSNVETQSNQIENFITEKVDAILINGIDGTACAADIKRAVAAGIPCIGVSMGYDSDVPVITSLFSNDYMSGFMSGENAVADFKGKSMKIAAVLSRYGNEISESSINGLLGGIIEKRYEQIGKPFKTRDDAIEYANNMYNTLRKTGKVSDPVSDISVVALAQAGNWTTDAGLTASQDIITAHPDVNLMLVEDDIIAMGTIQALKQRGLTAGKDVQIVCASEGIRTALDLIKSGSLLSVGYLSPDLLGQAPIDLLHNIFEDGYDANNLPAMSYLPVYAITKANVSTFYDPKMTFAKILPFSFKTIDQINSEASSSSN